LKYSESEKPKKKLNAPQTTVPLSQNKKNGSGR